MKPNYINPWAEALPIPQEWAILAALASVKRLETDCYGIQRDDIVSQRRAARNYHKMCTDQKIDFYIIPSLNGNHIIGYRWGNDTCQYGSVHTDTTLCGPILDTIVRLAQALND
jgi:hypothetical protein